jgi:hypothetical protein
MVMHETVLKYCLLLEGNLKVKTKENGVKNTKKVLIVNVQKDFRKNNIVNMEKSSILF